MLPAAAEALGERVERVRAQLEAAEAELQARRAQAERERAQTKAGLKGASTSAVAHELNTLVLRLLTRGQREGQWPVGKRGAAAGDGAGDTQALPPVETSGVAYRSFAASRELDAVLEAIATSGPRIDFLSASGNGAAAVRASARFTTVAVRNTLRMSPGDDASAGRDHRPTDDKVSVLVSRDLTFRDLREIVCRKWGVAVEDPMFRLADEAGVVWPDSRRVYDELLRDGRSTTSDPPMLLLGYKLTGMRITDLHAALKKSASMPDTVSGTAPLLFDGGSSSSSGSGGGGGGGGGSGRQSPDTIQHTSRAAKAPSSRSIFRLTPVLCTEGKVQWDFVVYLVLLVLVASWLAVFVNVFDSHEIFQLVSTSLATTRFRSDNVYIDMSQITTWPQFWDWLEHVLRPNLSPVAAFNSSIEAPPLLFASAMLLATPIQFRQSRVANATFAACHGGLTLPSGASSRLLNRACYPEYDPTKRDFSSPPDADCDPTVCGGSWVTVDVCCAYRFQDTPGAIGYELSAPTLVPPGPVQALHGKFAWYDTSGYLAYVNASTSAQWDAVVQPLSEGSSWTSPAWKFQASPARPHPWLDVATRLLTIEFALFNSNLNMLTNVRCVFEQSATGAFVSRVLVVSVSPLVGVPSWLIVYACAVSLLGLWMLFIEALHWRLAYELVRFHLRDRGFVLRESRLSCFVNGSIRYLGSLRSWLNLLIVGLLYTGMVLISLAWTAPRVNEFFVPLEDLVPNPASEAAPYVSFEGVYTYQMSGTICTGTAFVLLCAKLLTYFDLVRFCTVVCRRPSRSSQIMPSHAICCFCHA